MIVYAVQEGVKILKVSKDRQYLVDYMLSFPREIRKGMQLITLKSYEVRR